MKKNFKYGTGVVTICLLVSLIIILSDTEFFVDRPLRSYAWIIPIQFILTAVGFFVLLLFYEIGKNIRKAFNNEIFETFVRLRTLMFFQRLRRKNAEYIAPRLQAFLYTVAKENQAILNIPIGKDMTSLAPYGSGISDRSGCLFYQFQILLPADFDSSVIHRDLIQSCILAELRNYGIAGLMSTYSDGKLGTFFSVYLDRLLINQEQHLITFEILYVTSHASALYMQRALARDNMEPTEREVFDDEIK